MKKLDISTNIKNNRNFATSSNLIFGSTLLDNEDYFIRDCTLPGVTFTSTEVYAPNTPFNTSLQAEPDTIQYDPLEVTLLCDEDLEIWKSIVNKAKMCTNGDLNEKFKDRSKAWIFIKDANGNTKKEIVFRDCIITMISSLDYSTADTDDALSFSITLTFSEFNIVTNNTEGNIDNAPSLRK